MSNRTHFYIEMTPPAPTEDLRTHFIITCAHDGRLRPDEIGRLRPDEIGPLMQIAPRARGAVYTARQANGDLKRKANVCVRDRFSANISRKIHAALQKRRISSSLFICQLSRKYCDVNRPPSKQAYEDVRMEPYWTEFHAKIDKAILKALKKRQKVLLVDIHGHAHKHGRVEVGYGRPWSPKMALEGALGDSLCRNGVESMPSPKCPEKGDQKYFSGGYIVRFHRKLWERTGAVETVQLELPMFVRRESSVYGPKIASALINYFN